MTAQEASAGPHRAAVGGGARGATDPRPRFVQHRATRPLRILYAVDNLGIGGTELNAIRTIERLPRARYQVALLTHATDGPMRERYEAADVPIHSFPINNLYGPTALRQALRLLALLRQWQPDVVHCHDCYTNITVAIPARMAGVPLVIASRRWWNALPRRVHALGNRWAYRHAAHRVLANSPAVGRLVHEAERVREDRIVVVPNFLDDEAFLLPSEAERRARRASFGMPADALVVGCVAKLRPEKDLGTLIRATRRIIDRHPSLHLLVVGDGPEEASLRSLAAGLGLADRVRFAGFLPNRPNPHALFDVSALCSLHEGFPNTIIEAMAAARPVVATRVGGVPDAVEEGVTGHLVPPGDEAALARALDELLTDEPRRLAYGAAARARARHQYDVTAVLTGLDALYQSSRTT